MNYDTIPFHEILFQLGITGWTLKKLPNNEEEFLAYFEIAIPHSDGVGIQYSNDSSKFGVTWDQIVAKKEELERKLGIFVTNLKPVKLRGIESNGMILAAQNKNKTEVIFLTPEKKIEIGSKVS